MKDDIVERLAEAADAAWAAWDAAWDLSREAWEAWEVAEAEVAAARRRRGRSCAGGESDQAMTAEVLQDPDEFDDWFMMVSKVPYMAPEYLARCAFNAGVAAENRRLSARVAELEKLALARKEHV